MTSSTPESSTLHYKILLGLVLGAAAGVTANALIEPGSPGKTTLDALIYYVIEPVGKVFLNLLVMTVVPLVFASLALGVAQLGDLGRLGRIGAKTLTYFVLTTALAVVIGLALVNTVRPGDGLPAETRNQLLESYRGEAREKTEKKETFGRDTFINIVPRNPLEAAVNMQMLAVIFVALLVGVGVTRIPAERSRLVLELLQATADLTLYIIHLAMRLAPVGVFALIFTITARFGYGLLQQLAVYVAVVLAGLFVQMFVVYPVLVAGLARLNPATFFHKVRTVILTAFSTSSSNATLPTSISVAEEELGVPPQVAGFVLPLGATMNMNGTALFEGVTAVFLAQVFGVELTPADQAVVVVMCVLTAIGAAGVPGGSIPLLAMVLTSVRVPAEAIALILGVDRILDMCRTTLNVTGDLTAAAFVTRSEGFEFRPADSAAPEKPEL